jgi:RNA polymerase sigma factor (sigma-70 family)
VADSSQGISSASRARGNDDLRELEGFYKLFYLPLVRRAVRRYGLSFEDAGDIVQDAFVLAVNKLDPSKNPKAWLYQVVDNLAVNWQRKQARRASLIARYHYSSDGRRLRERSADDS